MDGFEILNNILDESVDQALYETTHKFGFPKNDGRPTPSAPTGHYRNDGMANYAQQQAQNQNYQNYAQDYNSYNNPQSVNNDYYYQNNENVNRQNNNNQYHSQNYENQNSARNQTTNNNYSSQNNSKPKYPIFNQQYYSPTVEQNDDTVNVSNPYYYRRVQRQSDNQGSKPAKSYERVPDYPFYKPEESSAKEAIYNTSQHYGSQQSPQPQQSTQENSETPSAKATGPQLITRNTWGALLPMGNIKRMTAPAEITVFSINTGTPACYNEKDCRRTVKEIQARHLGEGLADIQYNFLVGGDGNVYEGRGWTMESGVQPNPDEGPNYNIAFIGRYPDGDAIPKELLSPVKQLLDFARSKNLMIGNKNRKDIGRKV